MKNSSPIDPEVMYQKLKESESSPRRKTRDESRNFMSPPPKNLKNKEQNVSPPQMKKKTLLPEPSSSDPDMIIRRRLMPQTPISSSKLDDQREIEYKFPETSVKRLINPNSVSNKVGRQWDRLKHSAFVLKERTKHEFLPRFEDYQYKVNRENNGLLEKTGAYTIGATKFLAPHVAKFAKHVGRNVEPYKKSIGGAVLGYAGYKLGSALYSGAKSLYNRFTKPRNMIEQTKSEGQTLPTNTTTSSNPKESNPQDISHHTEYDTGGLV
jgi:hypothetical protein